jgi:beta-1,4-mannosyl-glycoprotein beta-1,4-N-acetylglucosaminyltransferase
MVSRRIYDCFTFFNELDLLEIRLNHLNDIVDYFVLVEANKTHSGEYKPYFYEENKERYKDFHHKIIHIKKEFDTSNMVFVAKSADVLLEEMKKYKSVTQVPNDAYWELEHAQRNAISEGIMDANDNDIIMISDVDEIPSTKPIQEYLTRYSPNFIVLMQIIHYYYLNCKLKNSAVGAFNKRTIWPGTTIMLKKNITTPQTVRDMKGLRAKEIKNGGWHFSFLGNIEQIHYKLKSFAHSEYHHDEYLNKEMIANRIKLGKDILDKGQEFICFDLNLFKNDYPEYLIENQNKFSKLIKPTKQIEL